MQRDSHGRINHIWCGNIGQVQWLVNELNVHINHKYFVRIFSFNSHQRTIRPSSQPASNYIDFDYNTSTPPLHQHKQLHLLAFEFWYAYEQTHTKRKKMNRMKMKSNARKRHEGYVLRAIMCHWQRRVDGMEKGERKRNEKMTKTKTKHGWWRCCNSIDDSNQNWISNNFSCFLYSSECQSLLLLLPFATLASLELRFSFWWCKAPFMVLLGTQ